MVHMHFPGLHRSLPINDCYHWCLPTLSFYKLPLITVLFYIPLPGCFFYKECLTQQLKSFKGMPLAKRYTATFSPSPPSDLSGPCPPLNVPLCNLPYAASYDLPRNHWKYLPFLLYFLWLVVSSPYNTLSFAWLNCFPSFKTQSKSHVFCEVAPDLFRKITLQGDWNWSYITVPMVFCTNYSCRGSFYFCFLLL